MRRFRIIVVALLTAAVAIHPCAAQGTSEYLPNPISTVQVKQYGDLLNLSDQQSQAVAAFHLRYAKDFQTLREGEIEAYVKTFASGFIIKSDLHKRYDLAGKIASLDNHFFDQVQTILADEQAGMLPRVRQLRQRDRLMQNRFLWSNRSTPAVDLSQIFIELPNSAEQRQLADQVLISYEVALTAALVKLDQLYLNCFNRTFAELERAGITEQMMKDQANAERIMAVTGPMWEAEKSARLKAYADINDLNRRSARRMIELLPSDISRQFSDAFMHKAYSEIYFVTYATYSFGLALKRTDLTDQQRQAVQAQFEQYKPQITQLTDEAMDLVDEYRRHFAFYSRDPEYEKARKEHEIALGTLDKASTALWKSASKAISDVAPTAPPVEVDLEHGDIFNGRDRRAAMGIPWSGIDLAIRVPIGSVELDEYAGRLQLDEIQRSALRSLHAQYMDQYSLIRDNELKALREANESLRPAATPENRYPDPTLESTKRLDAARRPAIDAAHRVDQAFFDQLEQTIVNSSQKLQMPRVRLARQRQWFNTGSYGGEFGIYGPGNSNEAALDLSWMAHHLPFMTSSLPSLESILVDYENAIAPLMEAKFNAWIDYDAAENTCLAERGKLQAETGKDIIDMADRDYELTNESNSRLMKANEAIRQLNHDTLERTIAVLPADASNRLRRLYDRLSYPQIFNDEACAERSLDGALKLEDLTDTQRTQLENLCAEYRPAYTEACRRMIESVETANTPRRSQHPTEQDFVAFNARQQVRKKLAFERQELNVRTIHQLRTLLNADQIQRLGGLPEPPERNEHQDY